MVAHEGITVDTAHDGERTVGILGPYDDNVSGEDAEFWYFDVGSPRERPIIGHGAEPWSVSPVCAGVGQRGVEKHRNGSVLAA